ncbi:MAG: ferritin family protein [Candidatus Zixiibacteriota bacterium]
MVDSTTDPITAIEMAIKREEAAYEFYMRHSKIFENEATQKMFVKLAEEEIKHKERLQQELDDNYYTEM